MKVSVKFRFNKTTGQVEVFEIDDQGSTLPQAEHNRNHNRIAREIGDVVERNPGIVEVLPGARIPAAKPAEPEPESLQSDETSSRTDRQKQAEP